MIGLDLPLPPRELRRHVGVEDDASFENPHGDLAFGNDVPPENYASVLDFGCGCGRLARKMMLQSRDVPGRYLGLDLYRPSIEWSRENLRRPGFEFRHFDAFHHTFNPGGKQQATIGSDLERFTLVNAHSVFTHIPEPDLEHYFNQIATRLSVDGVLRSTWFMFDKINFPMMQDFQNCIYINPNDNTNACIYDVQFVRNLFARHRLQITVAKPPAIRGHQWLLYAKRRMGATPDSAHVAFETDAAPTGLARPPVPT
ncbi:MAG: class I SAM-dependent methyltransferase [Alphaproteobacteria bacterium]|nr:class I SAM-dependent methyltransferase [Alphaproteobacteria bacterium]